MRIILIKGAGISGKATWAKEMVNQSKGDIVRICKKELSLMFPETISMENEILSLRTDLTITFLLEGKSVIWDNGCTSIDEKRANDIAIGVNEASIRIDKIKVEVKDFTHIKPRYINNL